MSAALPVTAATLFAATDIDDLLVLTALFAAARRGAPKAWQIVLGQYAGIGVLVAVSALVATGLLVVPDRWVGLFGLVPIALGVRGLLRRQRGQVDEPVVPVTGVFGVAALTIAGGADNVSVYVPVFRQVGVSGFVVYAAVFAVLVAVWCALAAAVAGRRPVVALLDRAEDWLVPVVFILIGVAIVLSSGLIRG